jgi:hypothetical protein
MQNQVTPTVRLPFWLVMLLSLCAGLVIVGVAHWLKYRDFRHDLATDVLRDVGIAVVVAVVINVSIELHSHLRREAEQRSEFRDEAFAEILGPEVWHELKSSVAETAAFCDRWQLQVLLEPTGPGFPEGTLIARSTLTYSLRNRFHEDRIITLSHEIESELRGTTASGEKIPRLERIVCRPLNSTSGAGGFDLDAKQLEAEEFWADDAHFRRAVTLPAKPSPGFQFTVQRTELVRVPGQYHWYVVWPTKDISVSVNSAAVPGFDIKLFPRHFNAARLMPRGMGVWDFDGVMLPGQGLALVASAKAPAKSTETP